MPAAVVEGKPKVTRSRTPSISSTTSGEPQAGAAGQPLPAKTGPPEHRRVLRCEGPTELTGEQHEALPVMQVQLGTRVARQAEQPDPRRNVGRDAAHQFPAFARHDGATVLSEPLEV